MRKELKLIVLILAGLTLMACADQAAPETEIQEVLAADSEKTEPATPGRGPGEIVTSATPADWVSADPENTLYIDIPQGRIVVLLTPDLAQAHVRQVKQLAREGYYDGLNFYRVIEGFVAQGGDESGEKEIKTAAQSMAAEFDEVPPAGLNFVPLGHEDGYAEEVGYINGFPAGRNSVDEKVWLAHCSGAFAFGRNNERDSAATEFYITLQPQRYLDRNLTVFGRVIWGMEHVQAITRGEPGNGGAIRDKSRWTPILDFQVAADVPAEERLAVEYFDTNSPLFPELIAARSNRPSAFFYYRPDYIGLCQLPLPVRLSPLEVSE